MDQPLALAFAVVAGIIRGVLPAPSRDVFLLGAGAFIAETALQAWYWAALALHPATTRPATGRVLLDVASYWGPLLTGATTTMIGAVTVLGTHFHDPTAGHIIRHGDAWRFEVP